MKCRLENQFFGAPPGSVVILEDDESYTEICDICFKKRKCRCFADESDVLDICFECSRRLEVKE